MMEVTGQRIRCEDLRNAQVLQWLIDHQHQIQVDTLEVTNDPVFLPGNRPTPAPNDPTKSNKDHNALHVIVLTEVDSEALDSDEEIERPKKVANTSTKGSKVPPKSKAEPDKRRSISEEKREDSEEDEEYDDEGNDDVPVPVSRKRRQSDHSSKHPSTTLSASSGSSSPSKRLRTSGATTGSVKRPMRRVRMECKTSESDHDDEDDNSVEKEDDEDDNPMPVSVARVRRASSNAAPVTKPVSKPAVTSKASQHLTLPTLPSDIGGTKVIKGIVSGRNQRLTGMLDSTSLYEDQQYAKLWHRFRSEGYVYLRGVLSREEVLAAREEVLQTLLSFKYAKYDGAKHSTNNSTDNSKTGTKTGTKHGSKHSARSNAVDSRSDGAVDELLHPLALSKQGWLVNKEDGSVITGTSRFSSDIDRLEEAAAWRHLVQSSTLDHLVRNRGMQRVLLALEEGFRQQSTALSTRPSKSIPSNSSASTTRSILKSASASTATESETDSVNSSKSSAEDVYDASQHSYVDQDCVARVFDPQYTWLRIKAPHEVTREHADLVYFKQQTDLYRSPKPLGGSCYIPSGPATSLFHCNICLCTTFSTSSSSSSGAKTAAKGHSTSSGKRSGKTKQKSGRSGGGVGASGMLRCDECFLAYHVACLSREEIRRGSVSDHSLETLETCSAMAMARPRRKKGSTKKIAVKRDHERNEGDSEGDSAGESEEADEDKGSDAEDGAEVVDAEVPRDEWYCPRCVPRGVLGTCWIPLQDVAMAQGTLAVLPGTERLPFFDQLAPWKDTPVSHETLSRGRVWHIAPQMQAGDLVLFDSRLIHASTKNTTAHYRLSLDFRWYLQPLRLNTSSTLLGGCVQRETLAAQQLLSREAQARQRRLFAQALRLEEEMAAEEMAAEEEDEEEDA